MANFSLQKSEIVRAQKLIDSLFGKSSRSMVAYSFRFSWVILEPNPNTCAVLFISSKKKLKTAVERNRRKRLLRELYRLNKSSLVDSLQTNALCIALSINYVGAEPLDFHQHQSNFVKALSKLSLELKKNNTSALHPAH